MSKNIVIVGAARTDLVLHVPRLAGPGETVVAEEMLESAGGRGVRQALAASRLGAEVSFVGCIGDDPRAAELRTLLTAAGVDLTYLRSREGVASGLGLVQLLPDGTSATTRVPGANARLRAADIDEASKEIRAADMLVVQAEVSAEAAARAIELAHESTPVLLHAAPATDLDPLLLKQVGLLVVTREQANELVHDASGDVGAAGLARRLACLGPERVVMPLGAEGAIHFNGEEVKTLEAFTQETLDARRAEDAFVAALAVAIAEGARLKDAVRMAVAAASLAGSAKAGLEAFPTREAVEELVHQNAR